MKFLIFFIFNFYIFCEFTYSNWMEESRISLSSKTMYNIIFPGTHDSGINIII